MNHVSNYLTFCGHVGQGTSDNQLGFGSDKVVFREMLSIMYICLKAIIKKTRVLCSVLYSCTVFSLII